MKSRVITAMFLVSLATAPGCLLEVDAEADGDSAWAGQALGSEGDLQDVEPGDSAPTPELAWADGPIPEDDWTHDDGVAEQVAPTLAGWLPGADPGPDPWHGNLEEDSDPADE